MYVRNVKKSLIFKKRIYILQTDSKNNESIKRTFFNQR